MGLGGLVSSGVSVVLLLSASDLEDQARRATVAGNLRDLSLEGVAFRAGSGDRLLYPGLELPVVEVAGGRDAGLKLRATVCHVGEGAEAGTAGLEVEPLDASMSERWWEQVARAARWGRASAASRSPVPRSGRHPRTACTAFT